MVWERVAAAVTRRQGVVFGLATVAVGIAVMVLIGANPAAGQAPMPLPPASQSARADALAARFPGADRVPLIVVVSRADGAALTPSDVAAARAASDRASAAAAGHAESGAAPPVVSGDGTAALGVVPLGGDLSGLALSDAVIAVRAAATAGAPPELRVHVTGGPAFGADIANAFAGANVTLLVVTASVVALLLVATYRSPVLWLAPLLVIGFADRVAAAVGTGLASVTGLAFDGATSGITSVLVFGAGTNYALLLISRYRQELRAQPEHRVALRRAVRRAGPAIVASNATVVLALLTLLCADTPSTRSLGASGACGLVIAAVAVLVVLPPLLAVCGRRLFWPFIPHCGADAGVGGGWHRVGDGVARRPGLVAAASIATLAALAGGLWGTRIGLSQTEQFRVRADSVAGYQVVAAHFPPGLTNPTLVVGPTDRAARVRQAIGATPGVVSVSAAADSPSGLTKWSVVTDAPPASAAAFTTVAALRHSAGPDALVGGADARALDIRDAAARDRRLLIPAILAVILVVLFALLRSVVAPPTLLAATILGALAALGVGGWTSLHVFGFPALDDSTPLFAFLFLAALGVDYTIFLVTRAREEAALGSNEPMVQAVSATGGVITSAGIVLAAVFCVLGVLPLIVMTQLGIIVGLGILLDTFVVRTLVIPALFALIGDRIWWPARPTKAKTTAGQTDWSAS
ncbi:MULTISPECIES: MMPL family transporter [unclassified Mycobacterium]|uniref:MMPL family transporter n=1 Tax=unclassified Mycobacterium TaxID=2642494 RepID=UPI0008021D18|nr:MULTISPECIES: MMPL family transporter [unclassified Mycobacterium]OBG78450.1 hypothetical protein A5700_16455 [Mycobacterium sp. E1214]OBH27844.1 hypothetical protein A5693_02515 [Mycobacterium sp. E1319]